VYREASTNRTPAFFVTLAAKAFQKLKGSMPDGAHAAGKSQVVAKAKDKPEQMS
jgi:hypothetical protein